MGALSSIEWCDHTFNPWVGCTKISSACDWCYAESWARRAGSPELWQGERRRTTKTNWNLVARWNREAAAEGRRYRVFCASLSDVFDNQVPSRWRDDLWHRIEQTPNLDWLLLTKRPQNIARMLPENWGDGWSNVWLGTTVETQQQADRRIPHLLAVSAAVRFLSCEPLLGPVDLTRVKAPWTEWIDALRGYEQGRPGGSISTGPFTAGLSRIDWVICGGESGGLGARPMHPQWVQSLRDQCVSAGVPFFFKQWGDWHPGWIERCYPVEGHEPAWKQHPAAAPWWPDGTRGFGDHKTNGGVGVSWTRIGKKRAGRHLDGRIWDEMPRSAA